MHEMMTPGAESASPSAAKSGSETPTRPPPRIYYYGPAHPCHESMFLEPPEGFEFSANRAPSYFEHYTGPPAYRPMRRAGVELAGRVFGLIGSLRRQPGNTECE